MALGIKISQTGKNVKTCPDKDLVFSSEWNTFNEAAKGSISFELNSDNNYKKSGNINHNLGYVPIVFCWLKTYDGRVIAEPWIIPYDDDAGDDGWSFFFKVSVSSTQLSWEVNAVDSSRAGSYVLYYLINIEKI